MTTCYGVYFYGRITHTAWTKDKLLEIEGVSPDDIIEIPVPPIIEAVRWYFDQRGLLHAADPVDALLFLASELGELSDAVVHGRGEWVRNHEREREVGPELADVLMMLCVTAERLDAEPLDEMFKKFAKKGYPIHE